MGINIFVLGILTSMEDILIFIHLPNEKWDFILICIFWLPEWLLNVY